MPFTAEDLIFAAGLSCPAAGSPTAVQYELLLVAFLFRLGDGMILAAEGNMIGGVSNAYLRNLLVGRCIYTGLEEIAAEIQRTYLGPDQRALTVCIKDAYSKICERGAPLPKVPLKKLAVDKSDKFMYNSAKNLVGLEVERIKELPPSTVCVIGTSKTGSRNPITKVHQTLFATILADARTGEIYDAEFNTVCRLTNQFIVSMMVGKSLRTDTGAMIQEIQARYLGDSRKAIATVLKDAQNKLLNHPLAQEGGVSLLNS